MPKYAYNPLHRTASILKTSTHETAEKSKRVEHVKFAVPRPTQGSEQRPSVQREEPVVHLPPIQRSRPSRVPDITPKEELVKLPPINAHRPAEGTGLGSRRNPCFFKGAVATAGRDHHCPSLVKPGQTHLNF